jgi:hypothetical protein
MFYTCIAQLFSHHITSISVSIKIWVSGLLFLCDCALIFYNPIYIYILFEAIVYHHKILFLSLRFYPSNYCGIVLSQFLKPPQIDFQPRNKSGKRKGTVKIAQTKRIVREAQRRVCIL